MSVNPIDPMDLPSNIRYFPRISPNSLKISPEFRANNPIQSPTSKYLFIKTKYFLLHLNVHFIAFNLIYWIAICGKYFLECSIGRLCPDWGNTARAAMAGLGSIGLNEV